jgi:hypothetical protein
MFRLPAFSLKFAATLGELRKAGIIAVDRKRIRILNRLRLERATRE